MTSPPLGTEPVNVMVPPLAKLNGYRDAFSFANPAQLSEPVATLKVDVALSATAPPKLPQGPAKADATGSAVAAPTNVTSSK